MSKPVSTPLSDVSGAPHPPIAKWRRRRPGRLPRQSTWAAVLPLVLLGGVAIPVASAQLSSSAPTTRAAVLTAFTPPHDAPGAVAGFGSAADHGGPGPSLAKPVVSMAATPSGQGYWLTAADGGIFTFGDAAFLGSTGNVHLNAPIVGIAATPTGHGYWLAAADGGVFTFGDAAFHGSTGNVHLNAPIVGIAATPTGHGYWLVAADGGIFTFGDAAFHGSTGNVHLNAPIVGMAATPTGHGYWLVAADGGVFTFGDAAFHGSTGNVHLNAPIIGIAATPTGHGYWLAAADGGIFTFGDATFHGSLAPEPGSRPRWSPWPPTPPAAATGLATAPAPPRRRPVRRHRRGRSERDAHRDLRGDLLRPGRDAPRPGRRSDPRRSPSILPSSRSAPTSTSTAPAPGSPRTPAGPSGAAASTSGSPPAPSAPTGASRAGRSGSRADSPPVGWPAWRSTPSCWCHSEGPRGPTTSCPSWKTSSAAGRYHPSRVQGGGGPLPGVGGVSPINGQNRALVAALRADLARAGRRSRCTGATATGTPFSPTRCAPCGPTGSAGRRRSSPPPTRPTAAAASTSTIWPRPQAAVGAGAHHSSIKLRPYFNHPGFVGPLADGLRPARAGPARTPRC